MSTPWDGRLRPRIWAQDFGIAYNFAIVEIDARNERIGHAEQITYRRVDAAEQVAVPTLIDLSQAAVQLLMDDLWRAGIRPTEARAGDGQVQALKDHLADMRTLVFDRKP